MSKQTENALATALLILLLSLIIIAFMALRVDAHPCRGPHCARPQRTPVATVAPRWWHCDRNAPASWQACRAGQTPGPVTPQPPQRTPGPTAAPGS